MPTSRFTFKVRDLLTVWFTDRVQSYALAIRKIPHRVAAAPKPVARRTSLTDLKCGVKILVVTNTARYFLNEETQLEWR